MRWLWHYGALPQPLVGINAYREFLGAYQALLGRVTFSVEDQLEDGDKVVTRWTVTAKESPDQPGAMGISIHRFCRRAYRGIVGDLGHDQC